ncbi:MAG: hypothetical protein U5K72_01185 [Balneolaceae bacterium]|nr:hypothetical protein [Balneolaceae bacterium]
MNIPENRYKEIEKLIGSEDSVVGIDAKKTHIIIIHILQQIENRLGTLESRLDEIEDQINP